MRVPSFTADKNPSSIRVPSYPVAAHDAMIWVFPGSADDAAKVQLPPLMPERSDRDFVVVDDYSDVDCSFEAVVENLLDPAHLQFTHEGEQGVFIGPPDQNYPSSTKITIEVDGTSFEGRISSDETVLVSPCVCNPEGKAVKIHDKI